MAALRSCAASEQEGLMPAAAELKSFYRKPGRCGIHCSRQGGDAAADEDPRPGPGESCDPPAAQIVIVRNRRMITARITIVRLPSTGLPYELTRTWAPPRTRAASARFASDTPATRTSMKALMSQGTPRFG